MKLIETFKKDDDVPDWLFAIVPIKANSSLGEFKFQCDVDVYEHDDRHWIIPSGFQTSPVVLKDSHGVKISACRFDVVIPTQFSVFSAR